MDETIELYRDSDGDFVVVREEGDKFYTGSQDVEGALKEFWEGYPPDQILVPTNVWISPDSILHS